jgi:hypothetical protein
MALSSTIDATSYCLGSTHVFSTFLYLVGSCVSCGDASGENLHSSMAGPSCCYHLERRKGGNLCLWKKPKAMLSRIASNTLEQRQNDASALHKSNHRMTSMHVARRCACVPFRTGEQYLYLSISSITTLNDYEAGGERDWEGNTAPDGSSPKICTVNDELPRLECKYLMRWSQIKKFSK